MSDVIEITGADFEQEVIQSDIPTEVDFWAPWCQPCLMVSPLYDKLSREYRGKFKFYKINVDENQTTAMAYQVMSIPMQMFFADGQKVGEIVGAMPERTIRAKVEDILRRFPTDAKSRLEGIVRTWTEYNMVQNGKLTRWGEKNSNAKDEPVYHRVLQAAKELETAPTSSYFKRWPNFGKQHRWERSDDFR